MQLLIYVRSYVYHQYYHDDGGDDDGGGNKDGDGDYQIMVTMEL
jgi:hypothetical protein